jgi:hypothetical protein
MGKPSSLDKAVAKQKKQQKASAAWWACAAWIGSGIYLFARTPAASFFSVKAVMFFLAGTFAASLTIGLAFYLVERSIAWLVMKLARSQGGKVAALVSAIAQVLRILEVGVAYLVARLAFNAMP